MAKYGRRNALPPPQVKSVICGVILFFACAFLIGGSYKAIAFIAMLTAFFVICFKSKFYIGSMNVTLMLLTLITVMGGLSALWAVSGKFAIDEFSKIVFALCSSLLMLSFFSEEGKTNTKCIASALALCAAILSFLSIDALSTRIFTSVMKIIPGGYFSDPVGVEAGVRMVSILHNPNVFAGCAGIGVLLGLNNVSNAENKRYRVYALCCLFVNSVGFLLAFSMGASAAIAVAFVFYIAFEYKENRASLLATMILTFVFAAVNMTVISAFSFDKWDGIDLLPICSLVICCVFYCTADRFVRCFLEKVFGGKAFLPVVLAIVILGAVYIVAAFNVTGPAYIESGKTLSRAAYPESGEYTLRAQGGEGASVRIKSQNRVDTMMHTFTVIYEGELNGAAFTVPEDSIVVYFEIKVDSATTVNSLEYMGEDSGSVPLDYKLLPDFIANRLQGLKANQNAIQRLVFFEDGIKLFSKRPLIGLGLGAFGSAVKSVQGFYYETNYVHNHYIQSLLDTGIIGFILFTALILFSVIFAIKSRKNKCRTAPALIALICFMAVHAATEVVFSSAMYLTLAFGVFAICGIESSAKIKPQNKTISSGFVALCAVFILVFTVLIGMNMSAQGMVKKNPTFSTMDKAVKLDVFEWEDYALSYVMASVNAEVDEKTAQKADEYALRLSKAESNTIHYNLTVYYLSTGNLPYAMESASRHMNYCVSSSDDWNAMYELLISVEGTFAYYPEFAVGVSNLIKMMRQWDEENIGSIELTENAKAFVARYDLVQ